MNDHEEMLKERWDELHHSWEELRYLYNDLDEDCVALSKELDEKYVNLKRLWDTMMTVEKEMDKISAELIGDPEPERDPER
jgi:hypothetical protein